MSNSGDIDILIYNSGGGLGDSIQLMPLFSAVMAIIIFKEKFELYHFVGAIFIVSGIYLSNKKNYA